ncbi:envelope biogenesis factor ElyC [Oceanimonas doudoroffii]|uniref:Envelope biogenesis factor ElyC n=1 Tax=Oceanimonas doudoroffii TaxID=84158 RepID=A0A233RGD0_9GAMM|nr:envelope biogenesis factor ElyC [Oceanimonas doudoroffii]OXY82446.1 envelope biogenesis factor ElyC [Oceanimonas doudoroffii]
MPFLFLAKKWLGSLLLPLPLLLFLALFGVILLLMRHKRSGILLVALSFLALMLLGTRPVANALMAPLESTYAPFEAGTGPVDDIIVLGAAQVADPRLPLLSQLGNAALARISEGIRLAHAHPEARLIVSGYAGGEGRSSAELYGEVAQAFGIEATRIVMLPEPKDTAEEAAAIAPLIAGRRAVLVSSASHLPRAMSLFAAEGGHPVPAPIDHQARESAGTLPLYTYLPRARYLERSELAWHEYLGRLWMRLGGQ